MWMHTTIRRIPAYHIGHNEPFLVLKSKETLSLSLWSVEAPLKIFVLAVICAILCLMKALLF